MSKRINVSDDNVSDEGSELGPNEVWLIIIVLLIVALLVSITLNFTTGNWMIIV